MSSIVVRPDFLAIVHAPFQMNGGCAGRDGCHGRRAHLIRGLARGRYGRLLSPQTGVPAPLKRSLPANPPPMRVGIAGQHAPLAFARRAPTRANLSRLLPSWGREGAFKAPGSPYRRVIPFPSPPVPYSPTTRILSHPSGVWLTFRPRPRRGEGRQNT